MKLKIDLKKVIAVFILIMVVGTAFIGDFNTVYGKVNSVYEASGEVGTIDLQKAESDTTILDAIGHFLYALATFAETIGGKLIASFTGTEMFPWADRIIFNTVEFLDINFLSPSDGSMFRKPGGAGNTIFGDMIQNIYYTLFIISITFFGVVVGIMALRLAISSIASEKAKYKQAITNWLLALILIFTTHYLISFIFFVNEKMVEVASSIFLNQMDTNKDNIQVDLSISNDPAKLNKLFDELFKAYYKAWEKDEDVYCMYNYEKYCSDVYIKLAVVGYDDGDYKYKFYTHLVDDDGKRLPIDKQEGTYQTGVAALGRDATLQIQFDGTANWDGSPNWDETDALTGGIPDQNVQNFLSDRFKYYMSVLLTNSTYLENRWGLADAIYSTTGWSDLQTLILGGASDENRFYRDFRRLINDTLTIMNSDPEVFKMVYGDKVLPHYMNIGTVSGWLMNDEGILSWETSDKAYENDVNIFINNVIKSVYLKGDLSDVDSKEIINNLADYFKKAVYISNFDEDADTSEDEEILNVEFQPIVGILYAIFVIQSIMYFIAYMKRFFYIIVLALFAPLVIIYDFLMKSAM